MRIDYKDNGLRKVCTDIRKAEKKHGVLMAEKIHMRVDQISAASSVEELILRRVGRCHPLTGDRQGQYAMDLAHPKRLVFTKALGEEQEEQMVIIQEIVDYH